MTGAAGTALVTGATSGIGLALARALAARGYDQVLIARDQAALARLKSELEQAGVKARALPFDLSDPAALAALRDRLAAEGLAVDLLVNNAGFGVHGDFAETDLARELGLARVQLDALLVLTKVLLPGMLARGYGRILNVGSVYSFSPVPFQAVYGACKAFMLSFSLALDNEVRGRGVTVTTLCPGVTRTAFRRRSGKPDKNKGMDADAVAACGLAAALRGRRLAVPGLLNRMFVVAARHAPLALVPIAMRLINTARGLVKRSRPPPPPAMMPGRR